MKFFALLATVAAIRLEGAPEKVNVYDGLIHNADGSKTFPKSLGGHKVDGVGVMVDHTSFKGPKPSIYTSENGSAMTHVDIVQSHGNGHIGGVWPYRDDTTGVQKAKVAAVRAGWNTLKK